MYTSASPAPLMLTSTDPVPFSAGFAGFAVGGGGEMLCTASPALEIGVLLAGDDGRSPLPLLPLAGGDELPGCVKPCGWTLGKISMFGPGFTGRPPPTTVFASPRVVVCGPFPVPLERCVSAPRVVGGPVPTSVTGLLGDALLPLPCQNSPEVQSACHSLMA
jgi:hypothetical protein